MAELITFPLPDGATYSIPDVDDENWGQNVTDFLVAIPAGVMPRAGTFSLTGDVTLGSSFGLIGPYFKSASTPISTAGFLRMARTDSIGWRNQANNGNLLLAVNSSNELTYNGVPIVAGSSVSSITGTANQVLANGTVATPQTGAVTLATPQSIATTSSPTFAALTLTAPLTVPNGGTGVNTLTNHGVVIGQGSSPVAVTGTGTAGQALTSHGASADPTFQTIAAGANTALSNLASVAVNLSLLPGVTESIDLGSATKQWNRLYLGNQGSSDIRGTLILDGNLDTSVLGMSPEANNIGNWSCVVYTEGGSDIEYSTTVTVDTGTPTGGGVTLGVLIERLTFATAS